jgi:hypothetical protein
MARDAIAVAPLRLIALVEQAAVIQRILRHLGLPGEVPARVRPARLHSDVQAAAGWMTTPRRSTPVPESFGPTVRTSARR